MQGTITRNIFMFSRQFIDTFIGGYIGHARFKSGKDRIPGVVRTAIPEGSDPRKFFILNALVHMYNNPDLYFTNRLQSLEGFDALLEGIADETFFNEKEKELYDLITAYIYSLESMNFNQTAQTEIMDYFRSCLYLSTMLKQIKKKKLIVGKHSETGAPLYQNIKAVMPTIKLFSTIPDFDYHLDVLRNPAMVQNLLDQQNFAYFTFPLEVISNSFTENDLNLLPTNWCHSSLICLRDIPDIGVPWEESFEFIEEHRRYVMPDNGVFIECDGYGDIVSIEMKEIPYRHTDDPKLTICFCKLTFADATEDVVAFNPYMKSPIISAYGDIRGFPGDLVLNLCAYAYRNLLCVEKINVSEERRKPRQRRETARSTTSGGAQQGFTYIPRKLYVRPDKSAPPVTTAPTVRDKPSIQRSPHPVEGYIRKGKASEKQKQIAMEYGVALQEGETFVRPYHTGLKKKTGEETDKTPKKFKMRRG